ncbi:MAG: hypothetical protein HUU20_24440 [Pirellulales bacterium]|nr:hypothetical protein [Pirellulales bacterium]
MSEASRAEKAIMARYVYVVAVWFAAAAAAAETNLVRNPGFETDADGNGVPDEWKVSGDGRLVVQTLSSDQGRDGGRSASLECTRYQPGNPAAHAMLCQMGVPVQRGKNYRIHGPASPGILNPSRQPKQDAP